MRIAIFHDYFRVIGGAEKLVLTLARNLKADIITSEIDYEAFKNTYLHDVNIIALGKKTKFAWLLPSITRKRFSKSNFKNQYDFFIFSGSFSIYASEKHSPSTWYCHTPLKGLYEK